MAADRAASRLAYLKLAKTMRTPAQSYPSWRAGLLLVAPIAAGALCLVFTDLLADSLTVASWGSVIGATLTACIVAILLYCPSNSKLPAANVQAEADSQLADERLTQLKTTDGLAGVEEQLGKLLNERVVQKRKLREEIREQKRKLHEANLFRKWQRKTLLKRNWRAMRGYEWEQYLVEVCTALGAKVERIGGSGDQGVDLIVEYEAKRIAVQAKGYEAPVNNKAVQEVYAGMAHHRCTACAVIINSRFRKSAIEIADSTFCNLIGEDEFPDFVMGRPEL